MWPSTQPWPLRPLALPDFVQSAVLRYSHKSSVTYVDRFSSRRHRTHLRFCDDITRAGVGKKPQYCRLLPFGDVTMFVHQNKRISDATPPTANSCLVQEQRNLATEPILLIRLRHWPNRNRIAKMMSVNPPRMKVHFPEQKCIYVRLCELA